jgi:hypothetical protein
MPSTMEGLQLSSGGKPIADFGQFRLFGGVRCFRQSLHADGIET